MITTRFIYAIPFLLSFSALFFACGKPLNLQSNLPTTVTTPTASATPSPTATAPAANDPLTENEIPTGTLQTFTELSDKLPYSFAHGAALQIGTRIYIFGGASNGATEGGGSAATVNTILEAPINSDGSLGTFTQSSYTLAYSRRAMKAIRIGDWVYIVGGYSNTGYAQDDIVHAGSTARLEIERAPISNGVLAGNFTVVSAITLGTARSSPTLLKSGDYLYVIGGRTTGPALLTSIERAPISGGQLSGTFSAYGSSSLNTARHTHEGITLGNKYYILGGEGIGSLASIEEATIAADGTLGSFSVSSSTIGTARNRVGLVGIGDKLYVFGGFSGGFLSSIFSTSIANQAIESSFTLESSLTLARAIENTVTLLTRSAVYVFGGFDTTAGGTIYSRIQRAPIVN